ncbi:hypothetical protein WJX73_007041 [Symbiochloris irregularis]|uniref:Uncharacterized protein n=1 Tax=Symbiochloris irregularis TaxID=706552 RepID=A0AAW1NYR6_9CHLO
MRARWLLFAASLIAFASVESAITTEQTAELHARRQNHHTVLHHQIHQSAAVNFKNLTEFVQVFDPPDDLDWRRPEEAIRSEQETFHPFAAFRSPLSSPNPVIKVFLQAEMYMVDQLDCGFSRSSHQADQPEIIEVAKGKRKTTGILVSCLSSQERSHSSPFGMTEYTITTTTHPATPLT